MLLVVPVKVKCNDNSKLIQSFLDDQKFGCVKIA